VERLGHGQAAKPHEPAAYAGLEQSIVAAMPGVRQIDAVRHQARPRWPTRAGMTA
jgi:hypothetical protein